MKGNISLGFTIVVDVCVILSLIVSFAIYFNKKTVLLFKNVSMTGYLIVYALQLFGGKRTTWFFIIVFPVSVLYILYYDYNLILRTSIAFSVLNIADIIYTITIFKNYTCGTGDQQYFSPASRRKCYRLSYCFVWNNFTFQ